MPTVNLSMTKHKQCSNKCLNSKCCNLWKAYNMINPITTQSYICLTECRTPKDFFNTMNLCTSMVLVTMSLSWFLMDTWSTITVSSPTNSLIKWWHMSICLVSECCTRFLNILIPLKLLHYSYTNLKIWNVLDFSMIKIY